MATLPLREALLNEFDKLPPEKQQQVMEFARSLQSQLPPGTPGKDLIQLVEELNFDTDELAAMEKAIEEGCERVDWDEW